MHVEGERTAPALMQQGQWQTVRPRRRVLVVMQTVTYAQRLSDVVSLLERDLRIQVVFTVAPHAFGEGVEHYLRDQGITVIDWEVAVSARFDLALAAGSQGVDRVRAPLIRLSHGAGHIKLLRGADQPAGERQRRPDRVPGMLSRQHLVRDGAVVPAAIALSHERDLRQLALSCPEARDRAAVVGDPCHDRIVASLPQRAAFRRALGLRKRQRLVVSTSTWGPSSNFGRLDALLPRLLGELPRDTYRTAMLVHPNVWAGHGGWAVRGWLADARRSGVALVPPEEDWPPYLVAADFVIGDQGSVTSYATLTGAPILVARFPEDEVAAGSPAALLAEQLRYAAARHRPGDYREVAASLSSEPGRFGRHMRTLMYRLLRLGEPAFEPVTEPFAPPSSLARWTVAA